MIQVCCNYRNYECLVDLYVYIYLAADNDQPKKIPYLTVVFIVVAAILLIIFVIPTIILLVKM